MCWSCVIEEVERPGDVDLSDSSRRQDVLDRLPSVRPEMEAAVRMVGDWYGTEVGGLTGGPLHVQLDDYNVDDESLDAANWELYEDQRTPELAAQMQAIIDTFRAMTYLERLVVLALSDGYIESNLPQREYL